MGFHNEDTDDKQYISAFIDQYSNKSHILKGNLSLVYTCYYNGTESTSSYSLQVQDKLGFWHDAFQDFLEASRIIQHLTISKSMPCLKLHCEFQIVVSATTDTFWNLEVSITVTLAGSVKSHIISYFFTVIINNVLKVLQIFLSITSCKICNTFQLDFFILQKFFLGHVQGCHEPIHS